jgi:hypothetical protein
MRENQAQAVFARFRQHRSKRLCREVLKLINEQVKILSCFFRHIGTAHCRELELRYQQRSQKVRFVGAYLAFRKVGPINSLVHDRPEVYFAFYPAQDVPNDWIHQNCLSFFD